LLRLSDENLATLQTAAAPLDPRDRGSFLEAVAEALRDHPINPDSANFIGPVAPSLLVSGLPALTRIPRTRSTGCRKQTCASDVQAMFRRRRHQPRRPPLAKIRRENPDPTTGLGKRVRSTAQPFSGAATVRTKRVKLLGLQLIEGP
jgi:hypothetical protein